MKKKTIVSALICILCTVVFCSCSDNPSTYQDYFDLGMRYLSEGNYQEAIIAFTAAIDIDPKQAPAYVGRGDAYVLLGETKENLTAAKADYEKAIELDEALTDAYLGLSDVYIQQGDTESALKILQQGLEKAARTQEIAEKITEIEGNDESSTAKPGQNSVKDFLELVDSDIQQRDCDHALDVLRELREKLDGDPDIIEILDEAISIIEQAGGLGQRIVFLPLPSGESGAYWNDWHEAFQSNTCIVFEDGAYKGSLWLSGQENVTIQGTGNTRFIVDSPYDEVVRMEHCSNVTLRGLVLGHDPLLTEAGSCTAGVINISRESTDILIEDCDIFGCGTEGVCLWGDCTIAVRNSIIRDCSKRILSCAGIGVFENCSFYRNGYKNPYENAIATSQWGEGSLTFSSCNFSNNMNPVLADNDSICTFDNCTFSGNAWDNDPTG